MEKSIKLEIKDPNEINKNYSPQCEKKGKVLKISLQGDNNSKMLIQTESTPMTNKENSNKFSIHNLSNKTDKVISFSNKMNLSKSNKNSSSKIPNFIKTSNISNSNTPDDNQFKQDNVNSNSQFNDIKVNNYMDDAEFRNSNDSKDNLREKSHMRLSHNEDEEDFLKANSSKANTDKESEIEEIKQSANHDSNKLRNQDFMNYNKKTEEKDITGLVESKFQAQRSSDSKKNLIYQEDLEEESEEINNFENKKPSSSVNLQFREDHLMPKDSSMFSAEPSANNIPPNSQVQNPENSEEEDLGLIAEPEAVDVSVCTENLEEFDHDESPQELLDSDDEEEDDDDQ